MFFVALVFFSVLRLSSADGVGPFYDDLKASDAVNDEVDDDEIHTLIGEDKESEGSDDDNYGFHGIQSTVGNDGTVDVSDSDSDEPTKNKKNNNDFGADSDFTLADGKADSLSQYDKYAAIGGKKLNLNNENKEQLDEKEYKLELAAGDLSELLGSSHHAAPTYYKDLSRRFVPVYPYSKRKDKKHRKPKSMEIVQLILAQKQSLRNKEERDVVPVRAPPDVVLAAMKNGTKEYTYKPSEPTEEVIRQSMLRSGNYWDNVWEEEGDSSSALRTNKQYKHPKQSSESKPITAKLVPGTKLYDLLSKIVKKTPKLVYIISN